MLGVRCAACGTAIPSASYPSWDEWCVPCQQRIKLEAPWYVPGMKMMDMAQAEANWKMEHGVKPLLQLSPCPFCGSEQADYDRPPSTGPRLSTFQRGPYVIECNSCLVMGSPSVTPEMAAQAWNRRSSR